MDLSKLQPLTPFQVELIKIIDHIEHYDPATDYLTQMSEALTIWDKLTALKNFYLANDIAIIGLAKKDLRKYFDIFSFDFENMFSPIEILAWNSIRNRSMVLYPQYPALNFILDFANPYLKIGVELDGKEFHEIEKDRIRDEKLLAAGWRIFRISGAECLRTVEKPLLDKNYPQLYQEANKYFFTTMEGVLEAIDQIFFYADQGVYNQYDDWIYDICIETLHSHKLANFKINGQEKVYRY